MVEEEMQRWIFRSLELTKPHSQTYTFISTELPLCISYFYHSWLCVVSRGLLEVDPWLSTCCSLCVQPWWGPGPALCLLQGDKGVLVKPPVLSHCRVPCSCCRTQPRPQQLVYIAVTEQKQTSPVLALTMVILGWIPLEMRLLNWSLQMN